MEHRLCQMASCTRRDAVERSACGIVWICPSCWAQVEWLSAHQPPRDGMGAGA